MISCRFWYYPSTFKASITHPTESLFTPAWVISLGTILITVTEYGVRHAGHWLLPTMYVLFWIYCGLAVVFSLGIYLIMWSTQTFTIAQMTPVWIFPAYPLLVIGPHASVLSSKLESYEALHVIIGGFVFQGIGFCVSFMIYGAFIYRLMTQKLPQESLRPGMFISVGPSGFTVSAIVGMGQRLPHVIPSDFMGDGVLAGKVAMIMATWVGLWLWGLAIWFFFISVGAHWSTVRYGRSKFAMTFYSYVFPNTALTSATFAIARALNNRPIRIIGCTMTCLLVCAWAAIFSLMIHAVVKKDILWPQKQEDREEGGWKKHPDEKMVCHADCPSETPQPEGSMTESGSTPPPVTMDGKVDERIDEKMQYDARRRRRRDSTGASPASAAVRFVDGVVMSAGQRSRNAEDMV